MEKIKEILILNNLYDQNKPIDIEKSNNIETFFQTYHTDPEKKKGKILTEKAERDENGFIILENLPFLYSNKIASNPTNNWILLNNGAKVLIKQQEKIIENELLIMYFLKSLNVSCANYEPVLLNGKKCLATPSFLKPGEEIIMPFTNNTNNIELTYEEAKKYRNDIHYLKTIFTDRIYGNVDRGSNNYGIIEGKNFNKRKQPKNCPLFDNGECIFRPRQHPLFPHLNGGSRDINETISYLLTNEEIMHWVINPMKKTNLQTIAERLKREKGFIVSDITYNNFENYFKDSETVINEELKNKGSNKRIKLT